MTYSELRSANAKQYCRQNAAFFGLVPTWGPLWNCVGLLGNGTDAQSLFNQIHDASIQAIAAQTTPVDWSQTYAAIKPLLDSPQLIVAIQNARWEIATSAATPGTGQLRTIEFLAHHIRDTFARAGLQHLSRLRTAASQSRAIDPSTLLATIITAVLGVVCPPAAAFSTLLEPVIAAIIKVLFASLTSQVASGRYGVSAEVFDAQVQAWAREAAAASEMRQSDVSLPASRRAR